MGPVARSRSLVLLDQPARRAEQSELCRGEFGLVDPERVELVGPQALPGRLHDDEAARIAQAAPARAAEECDQLQALAVVAPALPRAACLDVVGALA